MVPGHTYKIRLFDRPLVAFEVVDDGFGLSCRVTDVDLSQAHLLPWGLDPTDDGVYRWMESRALPVNRRYAEAICRELGVSPTDVLGIYTAGLGLSLNDSYWIVDAESGLTFDDVSLYDHGFSEALAAVAYTGMPSGARTAPQASPELSTGGTLKKAWRLIDGKRVLYKGATSGGATSGFDPGEPTSELIVSRLAIGAGMDAVPYGLDEWHGETCSTCECFCTRDVSYVPLAVAAGTTRLSGVLAACLGLPGDGLERLCDMFVLDAVTVNTDRHLTNVGVLRDSRTGKPLGLAPVFDNGRALFPNVSTEDVDGVWAAAAVSSPAVPVHTGRHADAFVEQVSVLVGDRQKELAARLADSAEDALDHDGIPEERARVLANVIRERAAMVQSLPSIDRDELADSLRRAAESAKIDAPMWRMRPAGTPS